ncbi:Ing1 [Symbiodinium sp. KB8]|nr:Ing1 [Symbiodinium sp. KB8]
MASGEVEDYVDELNVIAGTVRRDLDLIGKLDEGSHGQLEALKGMHISYLAGLKERVKAQKGKAASGEELQSVTADAEELAKIEAMHEEALSKSEEKVKVATRTAEMVQDALTKLETFMERYQQELRASGKWNDGQYEDDVDLDEDLTGGDTPALARNFSVGAESAAVPGSTRQASTGVSSLGLPQGSLADLSGTGMHGAASLAGVAANMLSMTSSSAANQAVLEQHALLANSMARGSSALSEQALRAVSASDAAAAAAAAAAVQPTHDAHGKPLTADQEVFCVCRRVAIGQMIGCDNEECEYEWFHLPCVNLKHAVDGTWFCPSCVDRMQRKQDPAIAEMKEGRTTFADVPWERLTALAEAEEAM